MSSLQFIFVPTSPSEVATSFSIDTQVTLTPLARSKKVSTRALARGLNLGLNCEVKHRKRSQTPAIFKAKLE